MRLLLPVAEKTAKRCSVVPMPLTGHYIHEKEVTEIRASYNLVSFLLEDPHVHKIYISSLFLL
jgi:hypothetical protein